MRVVSLLSSLTETVCALGCEDLLVGRSHECDYPPSVLRLPQCTEPKFPTDGTSYEIDQRIKAILQEGLSVYRVHAEVLDELAPDLVLTQTQCEVCAVSLADVEDAVCRMVSSRPRIVSVEPNSLADVWDGMRRVAAALECPERGEDLVDRLQSRMGAIAEHAVQYAALVPRVAHIEWIDPLMTAGNWVPELSAIAHGENLFGTAGRHSPYLDWEALRESDPDVIVVFPCGWDMARAREEMRHLTEKPGWAELSAVRNGRVYLTDGNRFFNRPGPRLVESLEILAELYHPNLFDFGHAGKDWTAFDG